MTDVLVTHTSDGGEIEYRNGQLVMTDFLETATYLSLWGGNERDSGSDGDDLLQWWGNFEETDENRKVRSRTQYLLKSLPSTSANLQLVDEAAAADLAWMAATGVATKVEATTRITAPKRIELDVTITVGDNEFRYTFPNTWTTS